VDLHDFLTQVFGTAIGRFDDQALIQAPDAVAIDDRGAEAFGDLERLSA
jgi:hypothetical protein